MSDIINILPEQVANQIAAGEVVDRPASAVKELLENAIDAGATTIQLIIKDAGRTLIQVIDNGCGMSDSDARLCFARHATSKIQQSGDLYAIRTMGFRGEALASIAAIAQVELKTKMHDSDLGTQIIIDGGEIQSQEPCTCNRGTSLAIKNLFYNVPARRNFLKRDSVELGHIEETFKRVAIVNHNIAFSFYSNGKVLYDMKAGSLAQRLANIYGNNFKERLFPVEETSDVVSIKGYVSKAEYAKKTRGEQYLFVNKRFIKHPALSAAIEKAYTDMIPDRYYPSYFLSLEVDPSRMDVNIHPTKTEVKFIDEHAMFAIMRAATKKALGQFSLATEIEFNPSAELDFSPAPKEYTPQQPQIRYNPNYNPFDPPTDKPATNSGGSTSTQQTKGFEPRHTVESSRWEQFFNTEETPQASHHSPIPLWDKSANFGTVMQLQQRFIITTLTSGLLVVDQHRAHERILYDRLTAQSTATHATAQQLLFPINCAFSPADADIFNELIPDLAGYGFEVAPLGKSTFVVTATPPDINDSNLQALFDQMIIDYKGSMMQKFSDRNQSLCRSLAHQLAVKAGKTLQAEEMHQMLADLFSSQMPDLSPDGKKTLVKLSEKELLNLLG